MSIEDEIKHLDENTLRLKVIIPLYEVNYHFVEDNHGNSENGVDILYTFCDFYSSDRLIGGVLLKAEDIVKSGNTDKDIRTVCNQASEALNNEFTMLHDAGKLGELYIVTSGDFNHAAKLHILSRINGGYLFFRFANGRDIARKIQSTIHCYNEKYSQNYKFNVDDFRRICNILRDDRFPSNANDPQIKKYIENPINTNIENINEPAL